MQNYFRLIVGQRGVITLPSELRKTYEIAAGKQLTLIDLGGVLILTPKESQIDVLAERLATDLKAQGESLENLMSTVRRARVRYED